MFEFPADRNTVYSRGFKNGRNIGISLFVAVYKPKLNVRIFWLADKPVFLFSVLLTLSAVFTSLGWFKPPDTQWGKMKVLSFPSQKLWVWMVDRVTVSVWAAALKAFELDHNLVFLCGKKNVTYWQDSLVIVLTTATLSFPLQVKTLELPWMWVTQVESCSKRLIDQLLKLFCLCWSL